MSIIKINNFDDLVTVLMSVEKTGKFVVPVSDFVASKHIIQLNDNMYSYPLENNLFVRFEVLNDCIFYKSFGFDDKNKLRFSRDDDKPYYMEYSSKGEITSLKWKKDDTVYRNHNLLPMNVDYKRKEGLIICNYHSPKNSLLKVSYVLFNYKKNKLLDFKITIKDKPVSGDKAFESFPDLKELTLDDCFDLSRIFTPDLVTLYEMIHF